MRARPTHGIVVRTRTSGLASYQAKRYASKLLGPDGQSFDTRVEAEAWVRKDKRFIQTWEAEQLDLRSEPRLASGMKLDIYVERFGGQIFGRTNMGRAAATNTVAGYRLHYEKRIQPMLGELALGEISRTVVRQWLEDLEEAGHGQPSRRQGFVVLQKVFHYAASHDHVSGVPTSGLAPLVSKATHRVRRGDVIPVDLVVEISKQVDPRYSALVVLLGFSALRVSEALALRPSDVEQGDDGSWTIDVHKQAVRYGGGLTAEPKSEKGVRIVPVSRVNSYFTDAMERHFDEFGRTRPIFTNQRGTPLTYSNFLARQWRPAMAKLDLDHTIHDLRHTGISLWIKAGRELHEISKWAGHHAPSYTADVYGHLFDLRGAKFTPEQDDAYAKALRGASR